MTGIIRFGRTAVGWRRTSTVDVPASGSPTPPPPPTALAPSNSALPIITGATTKGQTLSCSTGSWLNLPTGFSYQWLRSGTAISGANGATYLLIAADVAANISCTVTASNTTGSTPAISATVGPIIDLAPVNTVLPALTGTPTVGQVLTVSNGTWNNNPLSFAYAWQLNGSPISGAASVSTYTLTSGENGGTVTCIVTATNSGGSASATSNALGPVGTAGAAPTISVIPALSGDPVVGQTLFTTNGTWSGTVTSYTYQWFKDGAAISGETSDRYLILDMDVGSVFLSKVTAFNVGSGSTPAASAATSAVTAISLTNAITSVTRTSASTVIPMTADIAFASNVYEGYFLRRDVYSDSGLTTSLGFATHLLIHADLQSGATIDWSADGGPTIAATNWITYTVFTTSPNGYMYYFTFPTQISPTDAAVAMTWSATDKSAGVTLSTDHLTMTNTTGSGSVRANRGIGAGKKVYWEYTGVTSASIGAADASATLTPFWGASDDGLTETNDAGSWVNIDGGILAFGTAASGHKTRVSTAVVWTNTDVLGLSLDTTGASPILAAYLNGTLKNSITMVGISLPIFPATQGSSGKAATLNPGITPGGTDGVVHPQTGFVNP